MEIITIDINCDVGEGVGNESSLFPFISSCSVACGGHAGDEQSMSQMVQLSKEHQVKVGAHPSYPDKRNFGRKSMKISDLELHDSLTAQIATFAKIVKDEKMTLNHIKPHGALYNDIAKHKKLAKVFLKAVKPFKEQVMLYLPYASVAALEALEQGFAVTYEAFGDRNYNDDLSLVSRIEPNALIQEPKMVMDHVIGMARNKKVKSISGKEIPIKAETYCIHGDTATALQILMYLNQELPNQKVQIEK
ncbi:MAG: 5-oxoprolinase subunit PxpA [Croceitalea sp.]|nr:5-oxoprolinase subunit PxpA [Croceitalea sp.]